MARAKSRTTAYHPSYARAEGAQEGVCLYCGMPASDWDHVPPLSLADAVPQGTDKLLVPSCRECNTILGDRYILTIPDRALYLHSKYTYRYAAVLRAPDWDSAEVEALGRNLRSSVRMQEALKRVMRERLTRLMENM